ncbi:MAG: hypothetical protein JXR10_02100 [Cyclobacteriaceae bacterium]
MMRHILPIFLLVAVFSSACEPESEQITASSGVQLTFSEDTVLFDTLLSSRTSITKRLRIFNPNSKAVRIDEIKMGSGGRSEFSMIVNGKSGVRVRDEVLNGGDSLLILVDVLVDPQDQNLPYLVKDSVVVSWGNQSAFVRLVAYGQDAHFINSEVICDDTWTAERPYVIYNYAAIGENCTLTMEPGTRVFIDNGASLLVEGTLIMQGDSSNRILVRNTRFDEDYLEAPGQWNGIVYLETSRNNVVSYADIENGQIGLGVGYAFFTDGENTFLLPEISDNRVSIQIDHTSIRHMSTAGVLAFSSDVNMYNTEIYNAGGFLFGGFAGGNYQIDHCTMTNSSSFFINDDPMVQFSNNLEHPTDIKLLEHLSLSMTNSIIWGEGENQFFISDDNESSIDTLLVSNIIQSKTEIAGNYTSIERNFPGFIDPFSFDFQLDSLAFARDRGTQTAITDDLKGVARDNMPDIGAFERVDQ